MKETNKQKKNLKFVELCNTLEGIETYPFDKKILQYLTKVDGLEAKQAKVLSFIFFGFLREKTEKTLPNTQSS